MKNIIITLFLCLLFATASHAVVDTLYSEPGVDGKVFTIEGGGLLTNGTETYFQVGDRFEFITAYEQTFRGYLSFYIDSLPETITIYNAILMVNQYNSYGNNTIGVFPQWNGIPGGDTLYCLLDHIDYGPSIDTLDWTAGDIGDPQTIQSRFGVISSTPDTGWKSIDVTPCVQADRAANRMRTQFRLRFSILTDNDDSTDCLYFGTGNTITYRKPILIVDYVTGVSGTPNDTELNEQIKLEKNYPSPFDRFTTISYILGKNTFVNLVVYDISGKKVKTLVKGCQTAGRHSVTWNGRNDQEQPLPNGIYFYRLSVQGKHLIQKTILLK